MSAAGRSSGRPACGNGEAGGADGAHSAHGVPELRGAHETPELYDVHEAPEPTRELHELPQWLRAAVDADGEADGALGLDGADGFDALAQRMRECRRCALCETRTHVVVGAGNPRADVMLVGEAPGKNEDEQGAPFVGSAGKNLDALLELAGLAREDIYIANVLKCRPPANRNPRVPEVEACAPWLAAQIGAVRPAFIVTLGNFATRLVLGVKEGIGALHGKVHQMGPFAVVPMFHPAAVIYDRSKTELVREDFRRLGALLAGDEGSGGVHLGPEAHAGCGADAAHGEDGVRDARAGHVCPDGEEEGENAC